MSIQCPFCDSQDIEKISVKEKIKIPFYDEVDIDHPIYRCNTCDEEGDFDDSIEKQLCEIIDRRHLESAPKLLKDLADSGVTMTYFEKALRLPFRTTSRWKAGSISHAALSLLRLIRFSPKLLEVADNNFSQEAMTHYELSRPIDFFERHTENPTVKMHFDNDHLGIDYGGDVPVSETDSIPNEPSWVLTP